MNWIFVIPNPEEFPSGGNVYNQQIVGALEQLGQSVHILQPPLHKVDDGRTIYVWDTLFLNQMDRIDLQDYPGTHLMLIHHLASMYPGPEDLFKLHEKPILENMDYLWVTSEFSKNYLGNRGVEKPILVMPPIFNGPNFDYPEEHQLPQLLIAANLVQRKGVLDFLQLINQNPLPPHTLYITGSHDLEPLYAEQCLHLIDQNPNLNSVHCLGPIPQQEVFKLYNRADLYLSTSYFETFGMSIQEALFYGTPVLGIEGGNTSYLINGSGWYVKNMKELTDTLQRLLLNPDLIKQQSVSYENWKPNWQEAAKFLIKNIQA